MLLKRRPQVWEHLREVGNEVCAISEVTLAELLYGAECSIRPDYNRELVFELTTHFTVHSIRSSLLEYSRMKFLLRKAGTMLDEFDILIAATAVHHEAVMVTNNTRHFNRFPELTLHDWSVPR